LIVGRHTLVPLSATVGVGGGGYHSKPQLALRTGLCMPRYAEHQSAEQVILMRPPNPPTWLVMAIKIPLSRRFAHVVDVSVAELTLQIEA